MVGSSKDFTITVREDRFEDLGMRSIGYAEANDTVRDEIVNRLASRLAEKASENA